MKVQRYKLFPDRAGLALPQAFVSGLSRRTIGKITPSNVGALGLQVKLQVKL